MKRGHTCEDPGFKCTNQFSLPQEPNLDITLHIEANIDCLTFIDLAEVLQRGTANVEIDAYC